MINDNHESTYQTIDENLDALNKNSILKKIVRLF